MNITYTARRSLIAGHVAGAQYTLAIATTSRVCTRTVEKVQQKSLSARLETLWFNGTRRWALVFEPVRGTGLAALQEMLDSTESGELFAMTLRGETQDAVNVKRVDEGYTWAPFMELGELDSDWQQASIEVLEQ
jgi:hypothetical protein